MKARKALWTVLLLVILLSAACVQAVPVAPTPAQPAPQEAAAPAEDTAARRIRTIVLLSNAQSADPQAFEAARVVAEAMKQLGLDVTHRAIPWEQQADIVWYDRASWDVTEWRMVGRPERMDPDEFTYNLFHSSTAEKGYNFVGYINPEYDKLAEAQRSEVDREKRRALVHQAQQLIARDQPYVFWIWPLVSYVYNNEVWEPSSIVDAAGIGIKNFWTFVQATPKGEQKDMILNSADVVQATNPLYISGAVDSWITELIWDRLMRIGPDGLPQPWAAEKVVWIDNTTVDVTLRQGMKWHDGQPVTVDDVVFSFQAPMGDEAPMYKPFVAKIASIEALDERTVRFTLKEPYAAFEVASLAKLNLIPKHIWEPILQDLATKEENAESYQEEKPIGSGPFKFVASKPAEEVILEANPDHFSPPKMKRWILRIVPNVEAALGMLRTGELNFLSDYTGDFEVLKAQVEAQPNLTMVSTEEVGFRFLAFNLRRQPFDDVAFRQAVATAIPKAVIAQSVYKGFGVIADSVISEALEYWHAPNLPKYGEGDIAKAKQILADAGYEWDKDGRLLYPKGKTETLTSK
jgi:peptide/nickel transport system substrate-binding protein